jgi:uncharacterized protein
MRVAIAGSSGLIGTALRAALGEAGHEVVRLLRRSPEPGSGDAEWNPAEGRLDPSALAGIDVVVNLAGASIGDKRFSAGVKRAIRDSRVDGTALLARTMAEMERPPRALLNASAIGFYGDRGDDVLTEATHGGSGFLADVTGEWEAATLPAAEAGIRVVHLRTGIVLDADGGALGRMLHPFDWVVGRLLRPYQWGLAGRLGSGAQWWSWISLRDAVRAIVHLTGSDLQGPVNLVAPNPVTNREFTKALGAVLRRPTIVPIPKFVLWVVLGRELAETLLFTSARVIPARLTQDGFRFLDPDVELGLRVALDRPA